MTCTPVLAVILTDVQSLGGAPLANAPTLVDRMTLNVACALTGIARQTIYNVLCTRKDLFDRPSYKRGQRGRLLRLVTARDLETLRKLYPVVER